MTITEFLLARIAEDEVVARDAIDRDRPGSHWQWVRNADDVVLAHPTWEDGSISLRSVEEFPTTSGVGDLPEFVLSYVEDPEPIALPHIARHDPARVLAECAAKRQIVELHSRTYGDLGDYCLTCQHEDDLLPGADWPCTTLRLLALPYADHPDFDPAWRE